MYRAFLSVILIAILAAGFLLYKKFHNGAGRSGYNLTMGNIKVTSTAFAAGQNIPVKYSCKGENVNPPLSFSNIPANVRSLTLIMHDPDAPAKDWVHWTMWNINPTTKQIAENSVAPGAIQGVTDFGQTGYGGPCPPSGTHHYYFEIYALDTTLDLPATTERDALKKALNDHIIGQGQLIGTFSAP